MDILILLLGLLAAGLYKKDWTTLVVSGIGFVFYGLMIMNNAPLGYPYSVQFGILATSYGIYLCLRTSMDLITFKKKENKHD